MPNHRLTKKSWKIGCTVQKNNKCLILSSLEVLNIMKWFRRLGIKHLLNYLGDAMKYIIMEDRLLEARRIQWQDAKMSNLQYSIVSIVLTPNNCPNKSKYCQTIASHSPMSLSSWRVLKLLQTRLCKLGVEVASWHHHPNIKICKVCNENLVVDEYHLLIARSMYKVICEKYDDLLDGHDNVSTCM